MRSSARNQSKGRIVDVAKGQTTAHVRLDIGGRLIVTASVTKEAVDGLRLAAGVAAYAVVKAWTSWSRWTDMARRAMSLTVLAALCWTTSADLASAQDASGCARFKWSVDRERSAFGTPGLRTVEQGKALPGIMDPAIVALQPVADVRFERPPSRKPKDGTFGAVLKTPPLAVGGVYQITVSDDVWIDVVQDGRELKPKGFTGERDCPNVRKSVRFDLAAGQATVEISGSAASSVKVDFLPPENP